MFGVLLEKRERPEQNECEIGEKKEKLKHANIMLQRVKLNVKPLGEEAVSTTDVIFCFFSLSFLGFFFKLHLLDDDKFFSLTTSSCSFFLHIYRIK
jgi:hypothetical protein